MCDAKETWSRLCVYLIDYKIVILVEAGGVEPPSEKARNEENYVRIRFMFFDRHP